MLHTKSRGNWSAGSEKILKGFYHIYMRTWWPCDLCNVIQIPRTNFWPPYPWRLHTIFGFKLIGKAVSEEEMGVRKMTKNSPTSFWFRIQDFSSACTSSWPLLTCYFSIRPRSTRIKSMFL